MLASLCINMITNSRAASAFFVTDIDLAGLSAADLGERRHDLSALAENLVRNMSLILSV